MDEPSVVQPDIPESSTHTGPHDTIQIHDTPVHLQDTYQPPARYEQIFEENISTDQTSSQTCPEHTLPAQPSIPSEWQRQSVVDQSSPSLLVLSMFYQLISAWFAIITSILKDFQDN